PRATTSGFASPHRPGPSPENQQGAASGPEAPTVIALRHEPGVVIVTASSWSDVPAQRTLPWSIQACHAQGASPPARRWIVQGAGRSASPVRTGNGPLRMGPFLLPG